MAPMWDRIDPLAEKYYGISPYAYCGGDPVNRGDYDGREPTDEEESDQQVQQKSNTEIVTGALQTNHSVWGLVCDAGSAFSYAIEPHTVGTPNFLKEGLGNISKGLQGANIVLDGVNYLAADTPEQESQAVDNAIVNATAFGAGEAASTLCGALMGKGPYATGAAVIIGTAASLTVGFHPEETLKIVKSQFRDMEIQCHMTFMSSLVAIEKLKQKFSE